MRCALFILLLLLNGAVSAQGSTNVSGHLLVSFPSGNKMLLGYLYRPPGKGPFPGVIFHHGHHQSLMTYDVGEWRAMAQLVTSHGYILFLPDRHANTMETSEFSETLQDMIRKKDPAAKNREATEKYDIIHRDIMAALHWFQQQPDVNTNAIILGGQLSGAQHALYDAEKTTGVRAYVGFSPAVLSWKPDSILCESLVSSVQKCAAPVLLVFNENQSLAPAQALGPVLQKRGKPSRMKIYPASGTHGKDFIRDGVEVWGADVIAFVEEVTP